MSYTVDVNWHKNEKEGWYKFQVPRSTRTLDEWISDYETIVDWLIIQVEKPHRHARWVFHPDHADFKFRYERDYLMFSLRWS